MKVTGYHKASDDLDPAERGQCRDDRQQFSFPEVGQQSLSPDDSRHDRGHCAAPVNSMRAIRMEGREARKTRQSSLKPQRRTFHFIHFIAACQSSERLNCSFTTT